MFGRAPDLFTDASKSKRYAGGGYVSRCGHYRYFRYCGSAARHPIDFLEGDTVVVMVRDLAKGWRHCVVCIHIDNSAFQRSAVKGWSHAHRLQRLCRRLFEIALEFECVFEFKWLASAENKHADLLSREDGEEAFLACVYADGVWAVGPGYRHPDCGSVRFLYKEYSCAIAGDGPKRTATEMVVAVAVPRCFIHDGLPPDMEDFVDELLGERLKASSRRTVSAALSHWDNARRPYGWDRVIRTDDPQRGGKLAAFVVHMARNTELGYESISSYLWGIRTWFKEQRQADPVMGILGWQDFMMAVHVRTWTINEPRKAVPVALLRRAIAAVDRSSFEEVQLVVLIILLLFTFSRSECPLPKTQSSFTLEENASVADVRVLTWEGRLTVQMRLKTIKQDPRMQRPEASGNDDWLVVGDVADDPEFSVAAWIRRLFSFHGSARVNTSPFFIHSNRVAPLTYGRALDQFRDLLAKVVSTAEAKTYGLHSLRVSGWNGARRGPAGEELAVAQGGWHSGSQTRYDRFAAQEICDLPRQILEGADAALSTSDRILQVPPPPPPPPAAMASAASPRRRVSAATVSRRGRAGAPAAAAAPRVPAPAAPPRRRPTVELVAVEALGQFVLEKDRPSTRRLPVERVRLAG